MKSRGGGTDGDGGAGGGGAAKRADRTQMISAGSVSKRGSSATASTRPLDPPAPTPPPGAPADTLEPSEAGAPPPRRQNARASRWKPFVFTGLEKVQKAHVQLLRRLEWMLPNVRSTGEVSESVQSRLNEILDDRVNISADAVHVVQASKIRRFVSDPTFLAVLAPLPNKTRGLLEVELNLAHMIIDMLLGGTGDAVALRPLTDIEEGVLTYVLIETLKTLSPSIDPALPKLRLENVVRSFDEALAVVGEDENLAVLQLRVVIGLNSGHVRIFVPESVLSMVNPSNDPQIRRERRAADIAEGVGRLQAVKTTMRAEIGTVDISSGDLAALRERDVILVENLLARPDQGQGGTAWLRFGAGLSGYAEVELSLREHRYIATVKQVVLTPVAASERSDEPGEGSANMESGEGSDLLNDIPLQVAVELGRLPISAEAVASLKVGYVFDLNRGPGEPLDLSVNGKIVARGELVEIDGNLGVRILTLAG